MTMTMTENKQERKHLIITDELEMALNLIDGYEESFILIDILIKAINDEEVNLDELYSTTRQAFLYFANEKRIKSLILEENKEAKS